MFINTFNTTKIDNLRDPYLVKYEMCKASLELLSCDEDCVKTSLKILVNGLAEILRGHDKAVKKLHVKIIDMSLKESYEHYLDVPHGIYRDMVFDMISEISKLNVRRYHIGEFESVVFYLGKIIAFLQESYDIDFMEVGNGNKRKRVSYNK